MSSSTCESWRGIIHRLLYFSNLFVILKEIWMIYHIHLIFICRWKIFVPPLIARLAEIKFTILEYIRWFRLLSIGFIPAGNLNLKWKCSIIFGIVIILEIRWPPPHLAKSVQKVNLFWLNECRAEEERLPNNPTPFKFAKKVVVGPLSYLLE